MLLLVYFVHGFFAPELHLVMNAVDVIIGLLDHKFIVFYLLAICVCLLVNQRHSVVKPVQKLVDSLDFNREALFCALDLLVDVFE